MRLCVAEEFASIAARHATVSLRFLCDGACISRSDDGERLRVNILMVTV